MFFIELGKFRSNFRIALMCLEKFAKIQILGHHDEALVFTRKQHFLELETVTVHSTQSNVFSKIFGFLLTFKITYRRK